MTTEKKWLEKEIKAIDKEIKTALTYDTNNAKQSVLVLNLWKNSLEKRLRGLK